MDLVKIQEEVSNQLTNPQVVQALVATTFKGLSEAKMREAAVEGMMRGFTFQDFLEKNIYAIPFSNGYSLVTSIDYARKIGMRSGVVGKSAPKYEPQEDGDLACTVTVKRKVGGTVGEFTETVYFKEYSTGKNLWTTKPRTMIAKVAEMHALRMACPEELSQAYVEEEMEREVKPATVVVNTEDYKAKLEATKTLAELSTAWANIPGTAKKDPEIAQLKDDLKIKFQTNESK